MQLVKPELFEEIFSHWRGKTVGYLRMDGNVGDSLIDSGAFSLFSHFGVDYRELTWDECMAASLTEEIVEIAVSGGGNMGSFYPVPYRLRQEALGFGKPATILPQSFMSLDEDISRYKAVFAREHISHQLDPSFSLAPDLALAVKATDQYPPATQRVGMFLRRDLEARFGGHPYSLADPVDLCETVDDYLELAARYEHIITDRLHFAIAALLVGRRTTLLPNSYFKNRAMFDSWLEQLGCEWLYEPPRVGFDYPATGSITAPDPKP